MIPPSGVTQFIYLFAYQRMPSGFSVFMGEAATNFPVQERDMKGGPGELAGPRDAASTQEGLAACLLSADLALHVPGMLTGTLSQEAPLRGLSHFKLPPGHLSQPHRLQCALHRSEMARSELLASG